MALTNQSETILLNMLAAISPGDKQTLGAESTHDLAQGVAKLIAGQREQSMGQVIASLITGSCSNWDALDAAAEVADGATIYNTLAEFTAAKAARDANAMLAHAVAHALADKKHRGV